MMPNDWNGNRFMHSLLPFATPPFRGSGNAFPFCVETAHSCQRGSRLASPYDIRAISPFPSEPTTLGFRGRIYIDLPYTPINASIGCDLPWSIQLVENNLVFANRNGIYTILDTSSANENNIVGISRKINGSAERSGYLADVAKPSPRVATAEGLVPGGEEGGSPQGLTDEVLSEDLICSCDDGTQYYITANGKTWAWNYELSGWKDPSWFLLTNTDAVALICESGELYHLNGVGSISGLHNE